MTEQRNCNHDNENNFTAQYRLKEGSHIDNEIYAVHCDTCHKNFPLNNPVKLIKDVDFDEVDWNNPVD